MQLADTVKAREIQLDGSSTRVRAARAPPVRSQERLYALVAADEPRVLAGAAAPSTASTSRSAWSWASGSPASSAIGSPW